ncbi:MAG: NADH:ubiquinone reductase (Na(+)-transporting) subunit F [Chloroflexi bacterium]|nr:NADH:ubiquinone reductase (Na(+)-transporting) subunit F [Chloroflexota bacterium]
MTSKSMSDVRLSDYSLTGKDASLAVEKGLADAKWYATPIPKQKMRELLERRDEPAIRDTLLWFVLLGFSGYLGYLLWNTWWAVIPFAVYGILYASVSDSRWHESSHGTAFKTDWMNNALYELASFMVRRESLPWRWSHARHHSDTIIVGRDLEIAVQRPANLVAVCLNFFNLTVLPKYVQSVLLHSAGKMTAEELTYIPDSEHARIFARARIYLAVYVSVIALSIVTGSWLPLMYIVFPNLYGTWLTVIYGLTQHAGLAENVLDHRLNTRTVYMNRINNYLYWNMGYHIEHHMFPLVPYHALPKLHELIKADTPRPYHGLLEAYREIVPTLLRQAKDPGYFVQRELPAPVTRSDMVVSSQTIRSENQPVVDGWVEVCESALLQKEDVLRFDYDRKTYAIYRAANGQFYASDGICTHGNAHLADGFVKGTLIECAKHNGRFDIRDGSPQRLPVCVGVKTYALRESDGKLFMDLASAGGYGVTTPVTTYTFQVVSNENVATYIKELVLEPDSSSPGLDYQPGDYIQLNIPIYEQRSLRNIEIKPPYAAAWESQHVFDMQACNLAPCRRNYSLATSPAEGKQVRLNIRIATAPSGVDCNAGSGSAYVFGLKPGDIVTAIGPFGEFHIKETERELVYLGGGAGMAPLCSHLAHLLETRKSTTRISYWYGARSLQEMFYQDYFEQLASKNPNFSFHVALSDPQPEDGWNSQTGFIHEVLKREYLDSHSDPKSIEYFLCGPPALIRAATTMLKNLGVHPEQVSYDEF